MSHTFAQITQFGVHVIFVVRVMFLPVHSGCCFALLLCIFYFVACWKRTTRLCLTFAHILLYLFYFCRRPKSNCLHFILFILRDRRNRSFGTAQLHNQSIDSWKLLRNASTTLRPRRPRALQYVQIFHGGRRSPAAKDSFAPRATQYTLARHPFSLQLNAIHWPFVLWPRLRLSVRASATCVRAGVRKPANASRQSRR